MKSRGEKRDSLRSKSLKKTSHRSTRISAAISANSAELRRETDRGNAAIVITCEHGGYRVPVGYRNLFAGHEATLRSHRGWDNGALMLAKQFADELHTPVFSSTVTRLLVELNRSVNHANLFSEFSCDLDAVSREELLDKHWWPYRNAVELRIREALRKKQRVLHLSVHSFTPVWDGVPRTTDIGLLFDPKRTAESRICHSWQQQLRSRLSHLTIHRNAPYRGTADGFVTWLRKQFPDPGYAGIELEVNQKFVSGNQADWQQLRSVLIRSFQDSY